MVTPRRPRRWLVVLVVIGVLALIAAWWINRQLEPQRLTRTVLARAGAALQLNLTFDGEPEYALRPEPRLLVPNLSVSAADGKVFLFAKRAEISLPWSTITGDELVITRVELDAPVLNLPGLQRWLATRPAKPFELPTLSKGIRVSDGRIDGSDFSLTAFQLHIPSLRQDKPAHALVGGVYQTGATRVSFGADLFVSTASLDSDFTASVAGAVHDSPPPLGFKVAAQGHYASAANSFALDLTKLALDGEAPLPGIVGKGALLVTERMKWNFDGVLAKWPASWPQLPEPLASQTGQLPIMLSYDGRNDLADPVSLLIKREPTVLEASLRIPELQTWLADENASPLPPLVGSLRTPALVLDGVELQGVEVEISEGPAGTPGP